MKEQRFAVFGRERHDLANDAVVLRREVADGGRQVFERDPPVDMAQPCASADISAGVDCDGYQPGFGVFPLAQSIHPLIGFDKDLLRSVFGEHAVLQDDEAEAEDIVAVAAHQFIEEPVFFGLRHGRRAVLHGCFTPSTPLDGIRRSKVTAFSKLI